MNQGFENGFQKTQAEALPLCDAHAHPGTAAELLSRKKAGLRSLICASTPGEAEELIQLAKDPEYSFVILPTCGLHPWHAARFQTADLLPYCSLCPVIGEIGMDSVWCDVPLEIQERVFREQLAFAARARKPVILHTKGQEKEIASILREYPNTYLVHWYSCGEYLDAYLEQDCYFSIGPDVWWNPAVQKTAESAPLNRLLIETDGMGAVTWAYEEAELSDAVRELSAGSPGFSGLRIPETPYKSIENTLGTVARIRRCSTARLAVQVFRNFSAFLAASGTTGPR